MIAGDSCIATPANKTMRQCLACGELPEPNSLRHRPTTCQIICSRSAIHSPIGRVRRLLFAPLLFFHILRAGLLYFSRAPPLLPTPPLNLHYSSHTAQHGTADAAQHSTAQHKAAQGELPRKYRPWQTWQAIHSLTHSAIPSATQPFPQSVTQSLSHAATHSLIRSLTCSLAHSPTHTTSK